jgi:membrane protease YdiL (CAAX protease family)
MSASRPSVPSSVVFGFWFLLAVTLVSHLIGELAFAWAQSTKGVDHVPEILRMELPPFLQGVLFPFLVIRLVYRATLSEFGVHWFERGRAVTRWLLGLCLVSIVAWVLVWVVIFALVQTGEAGISVTKLHAMNPFRRVWLHPSDDELVAYVLHMFLLVGFMEELFGRGLLMNALRRRYTGVVGWGRYTVAHSTLLGALLFAVWHIRWVGSATDVLVSAVTSLTIVLVPTFALCLLYEKTRSMLAAIVLHNVIDGGKLVTWYVVGALFVGAP